MAITFPASFTQRSYPWSTWKNVQHQKTLIYQFDEDDQQYTIYGYDGPEVILCTIWKGTVPDGVRANYSQQQNDSDKTDWETNFKAAGNWALEKRETDGRSVIRVSTATAGRLFRLRAFSFSTSNPSALHNRKPDGGSYGDVSIKEYDAQGQLLINDFSTSVKTVLDFEAGWDIELIGGWIEIDNSIQSSALGSWYISVLGAPDVPEQYGGNIDFVSEVDLAALREQRLEMDGRSSAPIKYDPYYHSGKIRFTIKHPAGVSKDFQLFLETFR